MQAWRIYCGRRTSDGALIGRRALRDFLQRTVLPRFASCTVHEAAGFWGGVAEPSVVIEVMTSASDAITDVEAVAIAYKRRFRQDAVLIAHSTIRSRVI
jgi:hypothetical protein